VNVPAAKSVSAGSTVTVSGLSISDAWAAGNPGTMALNVYNTNGSFVMNGTTYTDSASLSGTLSQLNADLASVKYVAPASAGTDTLTMDVWNQYGVEVMKALPITITAAGTTSQTVAAAAPPAASTTSSDTANTISVAANDAAPVVTANNAVITATAGDHMIFIGGTNNALTATGGTETVAAWQGGNKITTGAGNDSISFGGSNNVINAGAGNNALVDTGNHNTIVLPGAGHGSDTISGPVLSNGDTFDLRTTLAQTKWGGDLTSIGNYLHVAAGSGGTVISVTPSGTAGGASSVIATLEGSSPPTLAAFLQHAITH